MNSSILVAIIAVIIGGSVFLLIQNDMETESTSKLKVGYVPVASSLPTFVLLDQKYLEEQGFEVEAVSFQTSNQLAEAVANKQIDLGGTVASTPIFAISQKDPDIYKILGTSILNKDYPFTSIVTKIDSEITVEDLPGKKLALFPGSTSLTLTRITFEKLFEENASFDYVQMPPPLWHSALESGDVDAVLSYEPFGTIGKLRNISKTVLNGPYENFIMDKMPAGVIVISSDYLKENPDNVKKIEIALQKSLDYISSENEKSRLLSTEYMAIDEDVALAMNMTDWEISKSINIDRLQDYADLLHENNDLESSLTIKSMVYGHD